MAEKMITTLPKKGFNYLFDILIRGTCVDNSFMFAISKLCSSHYSWAFPEIHTPLLLSVRYSLNVINIPLQENHISTFTLIFFKPQEILFLSILNAGLYIHAP